MQILKIRPLFWDFLFDKYKWSWWKRIKCRKNWFDIIYNMLSLLIYRLQWIRYARYIVYTHYCCFVYFTRRSVNITTLTHLICFINWVRCVLHIRQRLTLFHRFEYFVREWKSPFDGHSSRKYGNQFHFFRFISLRFCSIVHFDFFLVGLWTILYIFENRLENGKISPDINGCVLKCFKCPVSLPVELSAKFWNDAARNYFKIYC